MDGQAYVASLPLAERLFREKRAIAEQIYAKPILDFLRDGVIILPGAIPLELLDALDRDLQQLTDLEQLSPLLGSIPIDGPAKYYRARFLRHLESRDFRQEPPGLKLVDLQRYFSSAKQLAFHDCITHFLAELFGSPAALIQTLTFWKSSEQAIHQDFTYVHHHRQLGELAAAWIPLEDIQADAGPLVYYKGSHLPDQLGFYDWGQGSILASRDADPPLFAGYSHHLQTLVEKQQLQPSVFLPRRGDLLIWHGALIHGGTPMANPALTRRSFVCHYTSMASHKLAQTHRVGDGYSFDPPTTAPYQPSRLRRLATRLSQRLFSPSQHRQ
jgi:phytanoyl-CoA hydroxylase